MIKQCLKNYKQIQTWHNPDAKQSHAEILVTQRRGKSLQALLITVIEGCFCATCFHLQTYLVFTTAISVATLLLTFIWLFEQNIPQRS